MILFNEKIYWTWNILRYPHDVFIVNELIKLTTNIV